MNSLLLQNLTTLLLESGFPVKHWQKNITSYKNKHSGKKCILIGNGPSVRFEDLKLINEIDCVTFVFNRFHKVYEKLDFRPNYTVAIDPLFINDFFDELLSNSRGELFIGHHKQLERADEYNWFKIKSNVKFKFAANPLKHIEPGGSVVVAGLQLAFYMGCSEFYLYGIDHDFTFSDFKCNNKNTNRDLVQGEGNHFIANYRSNKMWCPPDFDLIERAFIGSKEFLERKSKLIMNISRKSKLKALPTLDFDLFIKKI